MHHALHLVLLWMRILHACTVSVSPKIKRSQLTISAFSIQSIFSTIYKPYCYKALQDSYNNLCARHMCGEIERHCCDLFEKLQREYISSSRLHWGNMKTLDGSVALFRSNKTCLHCLRRPPERHLSCGHSICDECIRIFGTAIPCREGRIRIRCIYDDGNLLLDLKPRTAGARIMAIDGGGSRGVTPLEFMKELQKLLQDCPLHEMVDVACGSSSGKLLICHAGYQIMRYRRIDYPRKIPFTMAN